VSKKKHVQRTAAEIDRNRPPLPTDRSGGGTAVAEAAPTPKALNRGGSQSKLYVAVAVAVLALALAGFRLRAGEVGEASGLATLSGLIAAVGYAEHRRGVKAIDR